MRILLVEDDSGVAGFIVKGLTEVRHAVDLSTDGEESYAMANAIPYAPIILDIMLPNLDGMSMHSYERWFNPKLIGQEIGRMVSLDWDWP